MRRTLYWKRLLIVIGAAVLLGGTVFAVHHFQVKSQASHLKDRAEKAAAEAESDPAKRAEAVTLLRQYLKFRPKDEAAFQKYAALLLDWAKDDPSPVTMQRCADGIEEFLRAFPNHPEERLKLAELYYQSGLFAKLPTAKAHLEMILKASGSKYRTDVDALELAAECENALGNLISAIDYLEEAIKTGKAPVHLYLRVMEFHYANKGDAKRNTYIDDHLRALRSGRFEKDLHARVSAARFEMFLATQGPMSLGSANLGQAREDMKVAFEKLGGANDADALLAMAELELKSNQNPSQIKEQHAKAEKLLRKAFDIEKKNVAVGMLLADVLSRQGKRDEGIAVLKQTTSALPAGDHKFIMVIDQLLDLGEEEFASSLVEGKLAPDEKRKVFVTYFRGRLAVLKQDWMKALKLLDDAAPNLVRLPVYHKKTMVGLAVCYAAMQNPDKQLEYCRLARRDDGSYPPAVIGEAEALVRMGRLKEALPQYRIIVHDFQLVNYRPELARLELLTVLANPGEAESRDWKAFDESLGPPEMRTPELHVLHAESLVARGQALHAAKLLEDWLKANPKDPKAAVVWVAMSRIKDGGKTESAWGILDEATKQVGDTVEIRLARAGLLVARAKPADAAEFESLAAGSDSFSKDHRFRLYFGLAQAAARVADRAVDAEATKALRATTLKFLRTAADLSPRDLACRAYLLDQGLAAERMDIVEQVLKEMALVEGENGPVGSLGRIAIRLPALKKQTDPAARAAGIRELRELASRVRELRPGWSRVYIAIAQLDEAQGLNDAALDNYIAAINKGDRQEYVIRRMVELYRIKQQDDKAVAKLNELSMEVRLPDDLERYRSIRNMLATDIPKESRPTIDRIAPADSTEYRIQLLRGSLLAAIRDDADALKAFRRAVELSDKLPETWASLVGQLVKYGKIDDAKRAVAEAEKKLTVTLPMKAEERAELSLSLGWLYEMVGDQKTALTHYDAACQLAPLELNPTRQRIMFFQRTGQGDKAIELLNKAKDSTAPDIARWARRRLALTMMARSDAYTLRAQALALIEQNLAGAPDDPEDLKARAVIWTVDPTTREQGIHTLRQYGKLYELTPDEWYLLGQLAFDQGKFVEASESFKKAARIQPGVMAHHIAALVRVYLALNNVSLAETALERLQTNHPTSWEAVREEARLLHRKSKNKLAIREVADAKKDLEKARNVIMQFPGWDEGKNLATRSGPLFEELGLTADAEAAYKKFLETDTSPGAHYYLAHLYIVQKQPEKAIQLARTREKTAPVLLTARLLTGAVRMKRPDPATEADIEKWLDGALRDAAGKPELEAALIGAKAELLDAQGKYTEAIKEYERSLAKGKSDLVVNNLCMLMALHTPERADEAVKLMSELIAIRGPVPAFLDTRAVAYLVSSRPAEAKKDLDMALVQFDRPAYRFHLAWALDLNDKEATRISAVEELKQAKRLGLTADDLHPIEYGKYVDLMKKYSLPLSDG